MLDNLIYAMQVEFLANVGNNHGSIVYWYRGQKQRKAEIKRIVLGKTDGVCARC